MPNTAASQYTPAPASSNAGTSSIAWSGMPSTEDDYMVAPKPRSVQNELGCKMILNCFVLFWIWILIFVRFFSLVKITKFLIFNFFDF